MKADVTRNTYVRCKYRVGGVRPPEAILSGDNILTYIQIIVCRFVETASSSLWLSSQ